MLRVKENKNAAKKEIRTEAKRVLRKREKKERKHKPSADERKQARLSAKQQYIAKKKGTTYIPNEERQAFSSSSSSSSSDDSEVSDYEETNEIPLEEIERQFHQERQIKQAKQEDKNIIKKHWICKICNTTCTNNILISCPCCYRPRGAILVNFATTIQGVAKTAFEKRRRAQRSRGQNPLEKKEKKNFDTGSVSSLDLSHLNRKQRRQHRVKARSKADKMRKNPKKVEVVQELSEATLRRIAQEDLKKKRQNQFLADKKNAGLNPVKKVKASFRSFFRRKLDEAGTFSKGLQVLFGDDYARDLQGIQRRPTCHFLPGITELRRQAGLDPLPPNKDEEEQKET